MMTSCYSYLLLLLYLLLITHWTNAASLRSFSRSSSKWPSDRRQFPFIVDTEVTTQESVLFRRRPPLIFSERQRRWSENDEEEIPIDNQSTGISDDIPSLNSTVAEIKYSLLRQDLEAENQIVELTTMEMEEGTSEYNNTNIEQSTENVFSSTLSNDIVDINSTEPDISPTNDTAVNQTEIFIEQTSTISQTEFSTLNNDQQDTAIILLDYTTIPSAIIETSETSTDSVTEISPEYNTTIVDEGVNASTVINETQNDIQEEVNNTTIISDAVRNDTEVTDQAIDTSTISSDVTSSSTEVADQGIDGTTMVSDVTSSSTEVADQGIDGTTIVSHVTQNDTSSVVDEEDEYSNETITIVPAKPICDQSCQCLRECPYGFEIINAKCQCDPPCKNCQCFGNDTCSVSKKGQPVCQPEKGIEHDRPFRCYQPRDAGYHDDNIRYYNRWYYNADQDTCHLFVYRGLGGNENNFQTLHECHLECITCAPLPDSGACLASIPMWYYDYKKKQCSQFKYSGCKGNDNKFLRKQECADTCITRILNL